MGDDRIDRTRKPSPRWPRLRVADWADTRDTLHMWTQIVGKIRMAHAPAVNHWWHVTLHPSARGLTTSAVPYRDGAFDVEFDFLDHRLHLRTSDGRSRTVVLEPKPVAAFYQETMAALAGLGVQTRIHAVPNEVEPAIPFAEDGVHTVYDGAAAQLFWRQLLQAERVIGRFRSEFVGKASPVHFFWGAMDLAYTRFSGRSAPPHPGGAPNCPPWVMREGYSHELASCGFWPGGGAEGAFYAYAYPEPPGYAERRVRPDAASYDDGRGEFLLPYEAVAGSPDPDAILTDFLRSTYESAADLGGWDRRALETGPSGG
ncbi:DUF5996 family protein [Micromonospora sp. 4G57]|uniref:DUF5996 family protein n=1 Tax=Micromonospora sicca TaxID=2202420 RepID=A0ABU5JPM6_9ACTN|nr:MULTISPECIES: DUF5996 family protein [unclassified Micromonospora]MDZ5447853.1 DUF5996 family protein [Micromonospora sp. 4G57]MDZ5494587.1 DUF5996 family protein [Micromonospora sp. 4G53]